MSRFLQQTHPDDFVTVSGLATYWRVCRQSAARIIETWELPAAKDRPLRYRWDDVWRCEGHPHVPQHLRPEMKHALLKVEDLVEPGLRGRSRETLRRRARQGDLPTVPLGIEEWRFRPCEIHRHFPEIALDQD